MADDISELQAIDFSLGAVISSAFAGLAENGPNDYIDFLKRPIKEKIFRAEHEDAGGLAKKIMNAEKGETISVTTLQKKPVLPVVAYFRKPGFSNGDEQANKNNKTVWNESVLKSLNISILPLSLEYSMTIAAWDKLSLDKLQIAWYDFIIKPQNRKFKVPSLIGDEILETQAVFLDPKTVMFTDTSPPKQEVGRIYSVSTEFTINTQVIIGESVTVSSELQLFGFATHLIE